MSQNNVSQYRRFYSFKTDEATKEFITHLHNTNLVEGLVRNGYSLSVLDFGQDTNENELNIKKGGVNIGEYFYDIDLHVTISLSITFIFILRLLKSFLL
ncbi:MAG: hypothetical protein COA82_03625 [Alkaliphilus sp.]|nr:MAG: hypothetical protein COA82_03625 [Alkaliphilus sp.]